MSEETKSVTIKLPVAEGWQAAAGSANELRGRPQQGPSQQVQRLGHRAGSPAKGSEPDDGAAATGETVLMDLAKKNTTAMLRGLFGSIGYYRYHDHLR